MTERKSIPLEQGGDAPTIYLWGMGDGREFACARDQLHAAPCPSCNLVDDMLADLLVNVTNGYAEARPDDEGVFRFRVTQKGHAYADSLISTDPVMAAFWASIAPPEQEKNVGP